jgi:hypothetical protein
MTEETEVVQTTPAPDATIATGADVATKSAEPTTPDSDKVFTQAEIDAIVGKRLARERRNWERENSERAEAQKAAERAAKPAPKPEQFQDPTAYAEALAENIAEKKIAAKAQEQQFLKARETYDEKASAAREKYDDFDVVTENDKLPISEFMAQAIMAADNGPEVYYHLGLNPKEAARIHSLPPILQAREIGKLEAKLSAEPPPTKKVSSAPAPISPVKAPAAGSNRTVDTTDPESVKKMSTSEWIAAENARVMAKLKAGR